MADDGDSGGIGDIIGDIVGAAGDELKKLGQSASSQITGSDDANTKSTKSSGDQSVVGELKKFGQAVTSQVTGSEPSPNSSSAGLSGAKISSGDDHSILGEFKKFGQAASAQISGHQAQQAAALAQMTKKDKEFSKKEYDVISAKIKRIYEEYAAKRQKEEKQGEMVEAQQEKQQKQIKEIKKKEMPRADIQKTRAEIKNYGAE